VSAAGAAFSGGHREPTPAQFGDWIEPGEGAVELIPRELGGLVRARIVPRGRLRGVHKFRSRLIPEIGATRRLGRKLDRLDRLQSRVVPNAGSRFVPTIGAAGRLGRLLGRLHRFRNGVVRIFRFRGGSAPISVEVHLRLRRGALLQFLLIIP
jgi:hypothetical protein